MQPTTQAIITAVAQKQGDLSDRQFSRTTLGISPSYYCLLKQGKRRPTLGILTIFMQKFPDLAPAVTEYIMRQGDGENPSPVTQNPVAPDTSPKKAAKTGVGNKAVRGNTSTDPKQQRKT